MLARQKAHFRAKYQHYSSSDFYPKMDTGQIARLTHTEAKSVRVGRYRKQKLELEKDDDLNVFLHGIA